MRILGIDPGSWRMGYALLDVSPGSLRPAHVASGTCVAPRAEIVARVLYLADQMDSLLQAYRPAAAAVETVFFAKNARSALTLGQARGAILLCLGRAQVPLHEYAPALVKQAIAGKGNADKTTVQRMVQMLLGHGRDAPPMSFDTSDALAVALCHAQATAQAAPWRRALGTAQ